MTRSIPYACTGTCVFRDLSIISSQVCIITYYHKTIEFMFYEQLRRGHFHIFDSHVPMVPNCHFSPTTCHTSTPCGSVGTFAPAPQGSSQVEKDLLRAKVHEALAVLVLACILTQAIFLLDVGCGDYGRC